MFPFVEIIPMIILRMLILLIHPIFWLVILLVAMQYRRMGSLKENFLGVNSGSVWHDVAVATGFGLAGGLAGSIFMVVIGLTLGEWILYLWPVAIFLMLINPRFLCFAYAGGILALAKLLIGYPPIKIPQLLALVAILHMVESILILLSGHLGAVPAYFKTSKDKLVGGFTLQRFWPIPLAVLVIMSSNGMPPGEGIQMPEWWPLIEPAVGGSPDDLVYTMLAVVAGLGYGDLAIARTPREKSKMSFIFLAGYSIILLVLALGSSNIFIAFLAALFAPLGHEAVIHLGKKMEFAQKPLYAPHPSGLRVLDVVPGSLAWQAGVRSSDVIVTVNGIPVFNRRSFDEALNLSLRAVELEYICMRESVIKRETVSPPRLGTSFGLLFIPEGYETSYVHTETAGPLSRWWQELRNKFQNRR